MKNMNPATEKGKKMNPSDAKGEAVNKASISPGSLAKAREILKNNPSVDLHTHLGYWEGKGLNNLSHIITYAGDVKLKQNIEDMVAANCKSAFLCMTCDTWVEYERQKSLLDGFFETLPMKLATRIDEIDGIFEGGKLAVFLTTEGGRMVEKDPGRMKQLYKDGIRRFQPLHYVHSQLGDNQTEPPLYGGLSPLGKEATTEAVKQGMILDAGHASFETTRDMANLAAGPIVLSHTMMKYDSSRFGSYFENRPRMITRDHASLIAETGGVIGTWGAVGEPWAMNSLEAYVEATLKMVDTVGIDHVGWATDYLDFVVPDRFKSYAQFPNVCASLLEAGFSAQNLIKFIGGNALRVQKQVIGS